MSLCRLTSHHRKRDYLNHSQNGFFRERFVDEIAHAAGQDPYQYRRRLLSKDPVRLAVLDAAAKAAGWDQPPPQGLARGIALVEAYGSLCAQVVEASVEDKDRVKVRRVVAALDTGHVVNAAILQVESGIAYGLTAALYGVITIENGRVQQDNFDDYEMLRKADMPTVETVLCRAVGSGAVVARCRCRRWLPRCATRFSRRPASAFVRCR